MSSANAHVRVRVDGGGGGGRGVGPHMRSKTALGVGWKHGCHAPGRERAAEAAPARRSSWLPGVTAFEKDWDSAAPCERKDVSLLK